MKTTTDRFFEDLYKTFTKTFKISSLKYGNIWQGGGEFSKLVRCNINTHIFSYTDETYDLCVNNHLDYISLNGQIYYNVKKSIVEKFYKFFKKKYGIKTNEPQVFLDPTNFEDEQKIWNTETYKQL